jgi:hypothetical protein
MKKTPFKVLLTILIACSGILIKPQIALAQVDMSILAEVAQSCQQDALSSKYYKKMLFDDDTIKNFDKIDYISVCIYNRYHHSLMMSKFPWLTSAGEIIPNYPGSVAVSLMSSSQLYQYRDQTLLIDCIASQNSSSQECLNSPAHRAFNLDGKKIRDANRWSRIEEAYVYICPSCVIAHDDDPSGQSMVRGFIKWFISLDKSKKREVISFLGEEDQSFTIRRNLQEEADRAVKEYQETREKIKRQEINRRREEVLNN